MTLDTHLDLSEELVETFTSQKRTLELSQMFFPRIPPKRSFMDKGVFPEFYPRTESQGGLYLANDNFFEIPKKPGIPGGI